MTRPVNLRKIRVDTDQLNRVLLRLNEEPAEHSEAHRLISAMFYTQHRLVVYGSLAPGEPNHHQLDGIHGVWERGVVHGELHDRGWGARIGYPALEWQPDGPTVDVHLFSSEQLPEHWARLDQFEGKEYRRCLVPVFKSGELLAVGQIYTSEVCARTQTT
jgi:gamma-glutamylcyclotransferase (GGCT)/AIG2-like uncharacterized protein YtfP